MFEKIESLVAQAVRRLFGDSVEVPRLTLPPNISLGDLSLPCFEVAKGIAQTPVEVASMLAKEIEGNSLVSSVVAVGPYVNIVLQNKELFQGACEPDGSKRPSTGRRVMVEFLSPNTNKPLHLGHIRNGVLGVSIANILEHAGNVVVRANLINDRGVHICKSMLAWKRFAEGATPDSVREKGDHFVGRWYVRFAEELKKNSSLEQDVQEMLRLWEEGDFSVIQLWEMMNSWVEEGFDETCKRLGFLFDHVYYESHTYKLGKDIVGNGEESGVFEKESSGTLVFHLPQDRFGLNEDGTSKKVTILRADGTSVYMTQDIGTALQKMEDHQLDASVYVVGSEQEYHFSCLFAILEAMGYEWARNCYHLSYGMVSLPSGKMKSREGNVVDADDLVAEVEGLAKKEIVSRDREGLLSEADIENRASVIGIGAIKFYLLKTSPRNPMKFNPEESISFDGYTGPYCQYAYARSRSIERKTEHHGNSGVTDFSVLGGNPEERVLALRLMAFPRALCRAEELYDPSLVAGSVYDVAKAFNQFYNKHSVLYGPDEILVQARLGLVSATAKVLKKGLNVLGIDVLEDM